MDRKKKGGARLLKEQKQPRKQKKPEKDAPEPEEPEKAELEACETSREVPAPEAGMAGERWARQAEGDASPEGEEDAAPEEDETAGTGGKKSQLKRTLLILYWVLVGVSAAIVIIGLILMSIMQRPSQVEQPSRGPTATIDPTGQVTQSPTQSGTPTASQDPTQQPISSQQKTDFFTFLIVGRDTYGGGNTDTILLCAYNVPDQELSFMSIPRDTLVNVSWDIKKINSVYNVYGGGDTGMEALKEEVSQLVGFRPDYTVVVEWEAVGEMVDAIGGVYFTVPRRMYYNDLSQNFKIDLQAGYQKLNGKQAMQLLRYRHDSDDEGNILSTGYADGDLGRIKVQQDFLKATVQQCLANITDLNTITSLAQVFFDNVTTPLEVGNIAWFAKQAIWGNDSGAKLSMDQVRFMTMPWVAADGIWSRTYRNHPSYVAPNAEEILEVVNRYFNPYTEDLRVDELDVMYVNADGTLGCTGGDLEDTRYNPWILAGGGYYTTPSPSPGAEADPSEEPEPGEEPDPEEGDQPSESPEPTESTSPSESPDPTESTSPSPSSSQPADPSEGESPSPSRSDPTPGGEEQPGEPSPEQSDPVPPEPSASDGPPAGIPVIP